MKRRRNSSLLVSIVSLGLVIGGGIMALAVLQLSNPEPAQVVVLEPVVVTTQTAKLGVLPNDQAPVLHAEPQEASTKLDNGLPVPATPAPPRRHSGTLVTRTNSNIRADPSTTAEKVAEIPKGTTVKVIGKEGEWRQVAYEGGTGWVREDNFEAPE